MDRYTGYDKPKNRRIHYLNRIFNEQLRQYGKDIIIDDISHRGVIENNQNPYSENKEDRILKVKLDTELKCGSYVILDNEHYLVITDIDKYEVSKDCKMRKCRSSLKWKDENNVTHEFYCTLSKDSYGSKSLANNEMLTFGDSKGKIFVQDNEFTRKIKTNWRFIMNGSETDIYKVIDISRATTTGLIEIVAQKDIKKAEDDIESSIAFNNFNEVSNESKYIIQGSENVKVGKTESYIITPHLDVDWRVDNSNVAEIISTKNGMCTILGKIKDEIVTLSAYLKESKIAEINISVDR